MEVRAGDDTFDGELFDENVADKIFGFRLRKSLVEGQDDDAVHAQRLSEPRLCVTVCQPEHERGRGEYVPRVRLECENQRGNACRRGALAQRCNDGLMPTVKPIEIADGDI